MSSVRFTNKSIPIAFALATLLAYGLLLPVTGFYWDDWPFAWIAKFLGPREFIPAFAGFRPFLGPIFFVTTSLIPPIPVYWQVFALIIRYAAGLSAWFALDQIWPRARLQTFAVALLVILFPGYSQNWVALTHINQEWIPFIFYLLSFGYSARAVRAARPSRRRIYTILALLLLLLGLFPTEYFIGLEPLRLLFIWVMLSEKTKSAGGADMLPGPDSIYGNKRWRPRWVELMKYCWPYLLIWVADAGWLAFYYRSGAYRSYDTTSIHQITSIGSLLLALGEALWKAGLYVWVQVIVLCSEALRAPTTLLTLGLIVLAFILTVYYFQKLELAGQDNRGFAPAAILIGTAGILLGRLPSFLAELPLTLQSSYDRLMISMMLGACLFAVGSIEWLLRGQRAKMVAYALLIAVGLGQQFFNANLFRRDWEKQQEIYWQLAWRMPALKPDTLLLTDQLPIDYETDLSFTASLNWMYAPGFTRPSLPYALIYTEKRLGGTSLPDLDPGTAINFPLRTVAFHGSTSQAVVLFMPHNGCLRVLDPALGDAQTYEKQSRYLVQAIAVSDPSRILMDSPAPARPPFLNEPAHTWCYYYTNAEQARQKHAWGEIVRLGHQAAENGYTPHDAFEWLPFIEAYARTGDLTSASRITHQAWEGEPKLHKGLCLLWKRVQADSPQEAQGYASGILIELGCAP